MWLCFAVITFNWVKEFVCIVVAKWYHESQLLIAMTTAVLFSIMLRHALSCALRTHTNGMVRWPGSWLDDIHAQQAFKGCATNPFS
jgi:hypothetical protein